MVSCTKKNHELEDPNNYGVEEVLTYFITSPHRKIGKERKLAKTDKKFQYLCNCKRKSTIGKEMGKKTGVGEEDLRSQKGLTSF